MSDVGTTGSKMECPFVAGSAQNIELDFTDSKRNLNRISLSPEEIKHIQDTNYSPELPLKTRGITSKITFEDGQPAGPPIIEEQIAVTREPPPPPPKEQSLDMSKYQITPRDSNDPSYTNLKLPYSVICRQRYKNAGKKMRNQFIKEIKAHELLRARALDGVRIHREFCNPIVSKVQKKELITLTPKQQARVEYILNNDYF